MHSPLADIGSNQLGGVLSWLDISENFHTVHLRDYDMARFVNC